jgi:hypothetical protein
MLTIFAVLIDTLKTLPVQERKHLDIPITEECVLHL